MKKIIDLLIKMVWTSLIVIGLMVLWFFIMCDVLNTTLILTSSIVINLMLVGCVLGVFLTIVFETIDNRYECSEE